MDDREDESPWKDDNEEASDKVRHMITDNDDEKNLYNRNDITIIHYED